MSGLMKFWRSGIVAKGVIILAGFVVLCCAPLTIIGLVAPKPAATVTSAQAVATIGAGINVPTLTVRAASTSAPAVAFTETSVPTAEATATVAPSETSIPATETSVPATETAAPTETVEPTKGPSPQVQAYFRKVGAQISEIGTALGEITTLMGDPQPLSSAWKTSVGIQLGTIQAAHETIAGIDSVPPEAKRLHAAILDATGDCNDMTKALASGIDTLNVKKINTATNLMRSCGTKISDAMPLLDELK